MLLVTKPAYLKKPSKNRLLAMLTSSQTLLRRLPSIRATTT